MVYAKFDSVAETRVVYRVRARNTFCASGKDRAAVGYIRCAGTDSRRASIEALRGIGEDRETGAVGQAKNLEARSRWCMTKTRVNEVPIGWEGKWRDARCGKARVFFSSSGGYWTLQWDGKRVSRHDSRNFALTKAKRLLKESGTCLP